MVGTRLKLENALKQQEVLEARCEEWKRRYEELSGGTSYGEQAEEPEGRIISITPKAQ